MILQIIFYLCRPHLFLNWMNVCCYAPTTVIKWISRAWCILYKDKNTQNRKCFTWSYRCATLNLHQFFMFLSYCVYRCVGNIRGATALGAKMIAASPTPQTAPWSTPMTTPSPCAWTTSRAGAPGKSASTSTRRPICRPKLRLLSTRWTRPRPPQPWWVVGKAWSPTLTPTQQAEEQFWGSCPLWILSCWRKYSMFYGSCSH